jgi:hypothetical protein
MAAAQVVARLTDMLSLAPGDTIPWDPDGEAPAERAWLALVLRYLAERVPATHDATLATLALFPDPEGRLHCAAGGLLLIPGEDLERGLQLALAAIGVHLVAGGYDVVDAVRAFHLRHPGRSPRSPGRAWRPDCAASAMRSRACPVRRASAPPCSTTSPRRAGSTATAPAELTALRELPLLRTLEGRAACAATPGVYLPGGFRPPALVEVELELVDAGPGGRWRPFLDLLGGPRDEPGALHRGRAAPGLRRARAGAAAGRDAVAAR